MKPWIVNRIRDTVRALLKAGANPRVKDVEQSDALDLALESDSKDDPVPSSMCCKLFG